jgi:hypothetical protein
MSLMQIHDFPGFGGTPSEDVQETSQSRMWRARKRLALHAPLAYYRLQKFLTGVRAPLAHTTAAIFLLRASRGAFLVSMLGKGGEAHRGIARGMR